MWGCYWPWRILCKLPLTQGPADKNSWNTDKKSWNTDWWNLSLSLLWGKISTVLQLLDAEVNALAKQVELILDPMLCTFSIATLFTQEREERSTDETCFKRSRAWTTESSLAEQKEPISGGQDIQLTSKTQKNAKTNIFCGNRAYFKRSRKWTTGSSLAEEKAHESSSNPAKSSAGIAGAAFPSAWIAAAFASLCHKGWG